MFILRIISKTIKEKLQKSNKVVLLFGARQLGKTLLSKRIIKDLGLKTLTVNADQLKYHEVLTSRDLNKLQALVAGYDLLFIDEAQRIPDLGVNLKIMADEIPELKILVTGSSSFKIANEVNESLTGRKWEYLLYPLSFQELTNNKNTFEINDELENLLIHGSYPEVYTTINKTEKEELLNNLTDSYLYKDILELSNIKHPRKIKDLLRLLAYQIGSEVSVFEISKALGINRETVENYLDLLEKSYVIFRLSGYSNNLRKEIRKQNKYYFYDLGIRNAIIENFKYIKLRNDIGNLWENFIISERKKYLEYNKISTNVYFWRTYTGVELDYIEEFNGEIHGYEIKWNKTRAVPPKTWRESYPDANYKLITKDNYISFLTGL
jgi:predicted AAA+ superfamily ATPase